VEIKIGITNIAREVSIETEDTGEAVETALRSALAAENGLLAISGEKGRRVLIPANQIGYLELGQDQHRPVGFGAFES